VNRSPRLAGRYLCFAEGLPDRLEQLQALQQLSEEFGLVSGLDLHYGDDPEDYTQLERPGLNSLRMRVRAAYGTKEQIGAVAIASPWCLSPYFDHFWYLAYEFQWYEAPLIWPKSAEVESSGDTEVWEEDEDDESLESFDDLDLDWGPHNIGAPLDLSPDSERIMKLSDELIARIDERERERQIVREGLEQYQRYWDEL
jgi:hypothetical protein